MRCPPDIERERFKAMLSEVPAGFRLTRTVRIGDARYFHFDKVTREGERLMFYSLEWPLYCKNVTVH